jgi:hypothetical protein
MVSNFPKLDPREEHFRIPGPHPALTLFLRHISAPHRAGPEPRPVLFSTCTAPPFHPLSRSLIGSMAFHGETL